MSRKYRKVKHSSANVSATQKAYVKHHINRMRKIRITQFLILISFFLLWEITTRLKVIDPFIFSSPSRVLKTFIQMMVDGQLFFHVGITLLETFASFIIVIVLGIFIAVILWWNDNIAQIFDPYLVILNALPKSALAPVFIVWLGNNMKTIIVAAVSVALFGTIINLYTDFINVEEDKIKLIKTLGGSKADVLFKVIIPSNIPSIISVMKINIGLSLVGVIIGEFLAAKSGLGYLIVYGSQVFKLDLVMTSIVILCVVATGLYKVLSVIEKKYK
ncbi:MAG TPA: ABC transporter permease [Clostridiales bacterium]|nr:ABC transporter permease [Clostridiales bacterium]